MKKKKKKNNLKEKRNNNIIKQKKLKIIKMKKSTKTYTYKTEKKKEIEKHYFPICIKKKYLKEKRIKKT